MKEAIQYSYKVRERKGGQDPPLPVRVDPLGANGAGEPRQVLRRRLLQTRSRSVRKLDMIILSLKSLRISNRDVISHVVHNKSAEVYSLGHVFH